jgi:hypothetical protein
MAIGARVDQREQGAYVRQFVHGHCGWLPLP